MNNNQFLSHPVKNPRSVARIRGNTVARIRRAHVKLIWEKGGRVIKVRRE
jgi:hypothetical protein